MEKRKLKVGVICTAYYESEIEIPDECTTIDEAINYAQSHIDEISVGYLDWVGDDELDYEACEFIEEV